MKKLPAHTVAPALHLGGRVRLSALLAALTALALYGCGFGSAPEQPETPPGPVMAYMIGAAPGASTTLDDPEFGKNVRLSMARLYSPGEECKRGTALSGQREAEVVVICRDAQGRWSMAPRVWGAGLSQ
jgi:hypothetical protein